MIISSALLTGAIKNHKDQIRKEASRRENFTTGTSSTGKGVSTGFTVFYVIMAFIFFVMELLLLIYSVLIAIRCTKKGPERIMHITLAVMFTLPYALVNIVFNDCAKKTLQNESIIPGFGKSKFQFGGRGCGCSMNN